MHKFLGKSRAGKSREITFVAVTASISAILSGCGAGGFGTLSGNLMDGYISGAKICIDLNGNGVCDSNEPSATTASKGSFTLTAPNGTDLSAVHLLAEIPANAVDEDNPGATIGVPYKMLAPASTPQVVSPLTTFVSTHLKDGKTLSQAQAQARVDLGLPSDHDFSKDYIARSDAASHNVAKMVASVLTETVGSKTPSLENLKSAISYAKPFAASAYAASDVSNIARYAKASAQSYTVMDFSVDDGDKLSLYSGAFTKLKGLTDLTNNFRTTTQTAVGNDDYIVYNSSTGELFYDASGNGSVAAEAFATLYNRANLSGAQFGVI